MPTFNFETPSLLRVPDALRASPLTSISSASSYGFDQRSKTSQTSQFTDQSLITPLGSVDSVFGNDPRVEPVPDLVPWDGLTDEQWEVPSKAECAIKEAEIGVFKDLDDTFFQDDIWYDHDQEFNVVAAVRAKLVNAEQTITTRRALRIIDERSGLVPPLIADKNSEYDEHSEGYDEDFELGDDEVPPNNSGTQGREQDSLFDEIFPSPPIHATNFLPPTPLIRPVDADTSVSTPKYISQLLMSPLFLDNPAIFHNSFGNINLIHGSPIVTISPSLFSSPTRQEIGLGLGLVGVPTSMGQGSYCAKSHIDGTLCKSSFGSAPSPSDKMLEGLGQRVVPYIPATLSHSRPTSNVVYAAMNTVTAGCNQPAAYATFATSMEASRTQKGMKELGLGFPMGLKQRPYRCSSGIPRSKACQDLASLAAAPVTLAYSPPRGFRRRILSPILEVDDSPQPDPYLTPETRPVSSPTKKRDLFKRALKSLFKRTFTLSYD